jgi:CTP synthase
LGSGKGLTFSGLSPDGLLVEIIELEGHPFFIARQFHPELRSRPTRPHPLFRGVSRKKKWSTSREATC